MNAGGIHLPQPREVPDPCGGRNRVHTRPGLDDHLGLPASRYLGGDDGPGRLDSTVGADLLSARSGVRSERISRVERGKVEASLRTLERLAVGLGLEVPDLFPQAHHHSSSRAELSPDLQELVALLEHRSEETIRSARALVEVLVRHEERSRGSS